MKYRIFISIVLFNFLSAAYAADKSAAPLTPPASAARMPHDVINSINSYQHCFEDHTWIVPPQTLRAYLYNNAIFTPVSDQTVWVFTNYELGYFFGESYSAIDNSILSQRFLIGSLTPEGKAFITFYSGTSASTDLVSGIGILTVKSSGQCTFTMQMNSGQNGVSGLAHWSYMIPVNPGDPFYEHLPGTQMSVPQFLAQF